jgi:hypothetical protein
MFPTRVHENNGIEETEFRVVGCDFLQTLHKFSSEHNEIIAPSDIQGFLCCQDDPFGKFNSFFVIKGPVKRL